MGLVLLATLCYGLATNLAAPLQARYGSRGVMARMLALATIWTLPFGLVGLPDSHVELAPLLAVIVLGVVGTGIAYLLMGRWSAGSGPTRASFITYLIPVVSLVLGVVFQDDHVAALAVVGVVLVVTGALLAGRESAPDVGASPERLVARRHEAVAGAGPEPKLVAGGVSRVAAGELEGAEAPVGEERGRPR